MKLQSESSKLESELCQEQHLRTEKENELSELKELTCNMEYKDIEHHEEIKQQQQQQKTKTKNKQTFQK